MSGLARGSMVRFRDREQSFVGHRRRWARLGAWREWIAPRLVCREQDQVPLPV